MNRNLDLIYTFQRWFSTHPDSARTARDDAALRVPVISGLIATHYSYEALIVAQAKLNPLARRQGRLQQQIDRLVARKLHEKADIERLEDLKDTLALLSGMEGDTTPEIEKRMQHVDHIIAGGVLDSGALHSRPGAVTADRLYSNQKVADLVAKAETEQSDYRRLTAVNVFFSPEKQFRLQLFGHGKTIRFSVYAFNTFVLLGSSLLLLCALYAVLKRQLRTRGI